MKKTIFEGKINDVIYNDVKDYNKAITNLLNTGAEFTASTTTKTVDVCEDCGVNPCVCGESIPNVNLYVGMDHNKPLADYYLVGDDDSDSATLDQLSEVLEKQEGLIVDKVNKMSLAEANTYLKDVIGILESIKDQDKINDAALAEAERKWTLMINASNLIDMFSELYNNVKDAIEERINLLANDNGKGDKPTKDGEDLQEAIDKFKVVWHKMFGNTINFPL
jgi:hypothetical protein